MDEQKSLASTSSPEPYWISFDYIIKRIRPFTMWMIEVRQRHCNMEVPPPDLCKPIFSLQQLRIDQCNLVIVCVWPAASFAQRVLWQTCLVQSHRNMSSPSWRTLVSLATCALEMLWFDLLYLNATFQDFFRGIFDQNPDYRTNRHLWAIPGYCHLAHVIHVYCMLLFVQVQRHRPLERHPWWWCEEGPVA